MADFERKLTMLADRGTVVGPEEMIERVEATLAEDPLVVVGKQRKGWGMSIKTEDKQERKQGGAGRGLAWAATVFALVVGLAVLFIALSNEEEPEIADSPTVTTSAPPVQSEQLTLDQSVEQGLVAYYAGDFAAAKSMIDFSAAAPGQSDVELRGSSDYFAMMNAQLDIDCEPSEGDGVVPCVVLYNDDLVRAVYGESVEPLEDFSLVVVDGQLGRRLDWPGPDSLLWSFGAYLAEIGELSGFEDCMRADWLYVECARIQQEHMAGYENWLADFDATERVSTGMEAWFEGDCALAITLFAGPVTEDLDDCLAGTTPDMMAYEREIGADVSVRECDFEAVEETAICTIAYSNALNEAVGAPPAEMTLELLVTPVEKAMWFYQREFYRFSLSYPHDADLDASFQTFAEEQGFGEELARACAMTSLDTQCSQLRLEYLDEWAAWHLANN